MLDTQEYWTQKQTKPKYIQRYQNKRPCYISIYILVTLCNLLMSHLFINWFTSDKLHCFIAL